MYAKRVVPNIWFFSNACELFANCQTTENVFHDNVHVHTKASHCVLFEIGRWAILAVLFWNLNEKGE